MDREGTPNAIYATCVSKFSEDTLVVADNFFNKTRANILAGGKASLLFFFNTLNAIAALIPTDPALAETSVERLQKTYGRGLEVGENEPEGTVVTIRIPV